MIATTYYLLNSDDEITLDLATGNLAGDQIECLLANLTDFTSTLCCLLSYFQLIQRNQNVTDDATSGILMTLRAGTSPAVDKEICL